MTEPTQDPTNWTNVWIGLLGAISTAGAWFAGRRRNNAAEGAEVAAFGAVQAEANADAGIYNRLLDRVTALEAANLRFNQELDAERRLRRMVENHVSKLERMMISAGITPPMFDPYITANTPVVPDPQ